MKVKDFQSKVGNSAAIIRRTAVFVALLGWRTLMETWNPCKHELLAIPYHYTGTYLFHRKLKISTENRCYSNNNYSSITLDL